MAGELLAMTMTASVLSTQSHCNRQSISVLHFYARFCVPSTPSISDISHGITQRCYVLDPCSPRGATMVVQLSLSLPAEYSSGTPGFTSYLVELPPLEFGYWNTAGRLAPLATAAK